jgi:hypothetical protein
MLDGVTWITAALARFAEASAIAADTAAAMANGLDLVTDAK